MTRFPCERYYSGGDARDRVLTRMCELAASFGFERLWFSASVAFCGEREGAAIYCDQAEGWTAAVKVTSRDATGADRIGREFSRRFGLSRQE